MRRKPPSNNSYISCMRDAVSSGQSPRACDGLRKGGPSMGQRLQNPKPTQAMQATPNPNGMLPKRPMMPNQPMSGPGNAPVSPRNVVAPPAQAGPRNLPKRGRGPAPSPAPMPRKNRRTY